MKSPIHCCIGLLAASAIAFAGVASAQVEPHKHPAVADKAFQHQDLKIEMVRRTVSELGEDALGARTRLQRLGASVEPARIDARSGRFVTLWPAVPMIPGNGVGNGLQWSDVSLVPPSDDEAIERAAWSAFRSYLDIHRADLGLDMSELAEEHRIASHGGGEVVQIFAPRQFDGIPVRGSQISAVISHGNLILMGMQKWGDRGKFENRAPIALDQVMLKVESYLSPLQINREWAKPELVYLPMHSQGYRGEITYRYQLAWSINVVVDGDMGHWEVLVNAHTGEILANQDRNHYAEAKGGVQPVTNDGVAPDGVEVAGEPMPFMEVGSQITTTGGNYTLSGSQTARFYGPYVNMADNCGTDSLTQSGGIDWGTSGGTDCTTPGFGGAGNTHASRDGFYEINKLKELARGQLPGNSWLQGRLTSNMNINLNCNAFWNGSTINFYRAGGGCANTGEIAGVFVHEWGHGMDDFDVEGSVASPSGEGIADIYTALRLNTSCIGRNFLSTVCSSSNDPCLTCTGVRDIDYLQRQSGQPHNYTWSNQNCGSSVHCIGAVYAEAVWSLWKRNLQSAPYNYDNNTAQEVVTRMTFIGAGAVSNWFSGGPPNGGCAASSGYQNYLAADDDNGNLNDGTPHMQAIYDAFNDQQIACNNPTVQDSGCSGLATTAPSVVGTGGNQSASLSWGSVPGANEYEVFRTEGVFGCDFGKVKLGSTAGTSFNDPGLQNGRDYYYVVIPKGSSDACFGPSSACTTVTPSAAPDFTVSCSPSSQSIQQNGSGNATCTVASLGGYTGNVGLSCSGAPSGVGCSFSPASVSPPSNGSANSTLTLNVDLSQATGTFNFNVVANDGSTSKTSGVTVTVTPEGQNGPQTASYDAGLGAPRCSLAGTSCDSGSLLDGRAALGPEPNQPNTIDTCTDGTSGSYHSDESNDALVVRSLDGFDMTEGATVEVEATVWAWQTGSNDTLDLYYAADANNPSWTLIASVSPSGGSAQTLTAQYTLPTGSLQAIRANFRYQGSASPCSGGNYDDADDLVFAVNGSGPSNTAPTASITAPANGSSSTQGDSVAFSGTASDTEDGSLTGSLAWSSSLDGSIGSGGSFSTATLSTGTHTITASVSDSGGLSGSDSITVSVNAPTNNAPTASITAPAGGTSVDEGTSVSFVGSASDTEDGDLTGSLAWSSSLDGSIGSGGSFSTTTLSTGTHTITASVSDSGGLPASDSISITVNPVGGGCTGCIDWSVTPTESYSNQDNAANVSVQDGGDTLFLQDNTWRRTTAATTFTVTANTVVEFDFTSTSQGEIHGLGFDEDNTLSSDRIFKVHGTQTWGIGNFDNYTSGTVSYSIPVGQFFTGANMRMVLVNDNDAGSGNDSSFTNVRVFESGGGGGTCAADEDFESGAAGWTTSGTCSTGTFVAGSPGLQTDGGVTTQVGGDHTTGSGDALFTATNTTAGNADVDGGTCIVTSPTYNVAAASDVSIWYFHGQRDAGDDAADGFVLEMSVNGGAFSSIVTIGDVVSNAAWTEATTTVGAGTVQFRVQATDGASTGDLVEAGVDDVSVCEQ